MAPALVRAPDLRYELPVQAGQEGVVRRERELAAVSLLLDTTGDGLGALLLEGEPGIGKSAVLGAALAEATARGLQALSCNPGEAEATLAFAALADLLAPLVDEGLPELPEPQRAALEVALLRALPSGAAPDPRAVGTAVRALLQRACAAGPVVLAIDDLQWLDRASASALAFALRRLRSSPVCVLATRRLGPGPPADPLDLVHGAAGRVERLRLEPLPLGALYHVIGNRLGHVFARPTLQRIAETSGGNPLFALELARALVAAGARPEPGERLPVPETLGSLIEARIRRLPGPEREALTAAAALATPDLTLVTAALGEPARAAVEAAQEGGLVQLREGRIHFTHPLLASALYASAPARRKRALHRALAGAVAEPEERARHLALAAEGPDEAVAAALDEGARDADARGAPEAAAELAELACRLTPPAATQARAARLLTLAGYAFRAGDTAAARQLAEGVLDEGPPRRLRAEASELLARILHVAGTPAAAAACCDRALAAAWAEEDEELRARIHATAALVSWHDFESARRHAQAALELLERQADPDPATLSHALMAHVTAEFHSGHGLPLASVDRALELERVAPASQVADRMSATLGALLKYAGDFAGARHWLEHAHRAALDEGDEASLPYVVGHLPQLELWTGNWRRAEQAAEEHLELAERTAQPDQRRQALFNLALVHAHLGNVAAARAEAEELKLEGEREHDPWNISNALAVLGLLELSLGDARAAAELLERTIELRDAIGGNEPLRAFTDHVHALVELGELARAEAALALFDERARAAGRPALLALAGRCRAVLAAAHGDLDRAAAALDEALAEHERAPVPFDVARTLIAAGQISRRRGERRHARDTLEQARRMFAELGAELWVARAEAELRRIPIRRGASSELTPTEEQVAGLAAAGRTNREIADALFISRKTVEANLARVYRKLGIGSRAELGATMAARAKP